MKQRLRYIAQVLVWGRQAAGIMGWRWACVAVVSILTDKGPKRGSESR